MGVGAVQRRWPSSRVIRNACTAACIGVLACLAGCCGRYGRAGARHAGQREEPAPVTAVLSEQPLLLALMSHRQARPVLLHPFDTAVFGTYRRERHTRAWAIRVLRDERRSATDRALAAMAAGFLGYQECAPHLRRALHAEEPPPRVVRRAAIVALGELKDPRAVPALLDILREDTPFHVGDEVTCVLRALDEPVRRALGPDASAGYLEGISWGYGVHTEGAFAARSLGKIGDPRALAPLIAVAEQGECALARAAALYAVGMLRADAARGVLTQVSTDGDEDGFVRAWARRGLLALQNQRRATQLLLADLDSADPGVRYAAVARLACVGDSSCIPHLARELGDNEWIRAEPTAPTVELTIAEAARRAIAQIRRRAGSK